MRGFFLLCKGLSNTVAEKKKKRVRIVAGGKKRVRIVAGKKEIHSKLYYL